MQKLFRSKHSSISLTMEKVNVTKTLASIQKETKKKVVNRDHMVESPGTINLSKCIKCKAGSI